MLILASFDMQIGRTVERVAVSCTFCRFQYDYFFYIYIEKEIDGINVAIIAPNLLWLEEVKFLVLMNQIRHLQL